MTYYCRQPDLYDESPGSSEYSTGSTLLSQTECYVEQNEAEIGTLIEEIQPGSQSIPIRGENDVRECEKGIVSSGTRKQGNGLSYKIYRLIITLLVNYIS